MKLRTQVSVLLVVLALVLSGIMFAGFQLDKEAITDQQHAETLQTSTEIAGGLDTRLESLERTVRLQATNPAVARHGTADQQQALAATVNETAFDGVSVIHRNGTMTGIAAGLNAETQSELVGSDFGDRQYFQRAMAGETYVSKPVAADTGNYIVTVSTPIYQNGTVVGTLNAALHLQNSSFFSGVTSAANSHHGVTIQSPGGEVIYDREPTPATNLVTKNATVDETGWTVQVQTSRNVLASELQLITMYQTGAVGLVILLIAGVGHVLYTRTVRYHERLVDGFDKIQKQEYGVQVSEKATSEWQQIFTAFNELSRTLADYEAEQTQQQKELQRERDRFSALFQSIPEPAVMVESTPGGTALKDVNEAFETTFGYDTSEAIGSDINDLIVPDSQRGSGKAIDEQAAAGKQITREVRREASDGVRDFLLRSTLSRGEGDEVYFGVYIDITDRKRQKRELSKTNNILTSVLGNLPVGVLVEDADRTITAANQTLVDVLGIPEPPEALVGRDCDRVVGQLSDQFADPDTVSARIDEILATGEPVLDEEVQMADGCTLSRSFVTYSTPTGTGNIWLYRDITDQKEHEKSLSRLNTISRDLMQADTSQAIATVAVESAQELFGIPMSGYWVYDEEADALTPVAVTDSARELLGEPPVLERGSSLAWEVFQSQEVTLFSDIPSHPARYNPETPIQSELILPVGDHGVLLLGATGEMVFDEADHSLATILAANVESALELATKQEQLLEQRTQLDLALEGGQLGVWDWDVQTDTVSFNEQWAAMLGYSLDEIQPDISAWSNRVHPEDLPMAEVALDAHFDGETEYYKCDHRMQSKSGDWIWVRDVGRVVERDDNGNPLRAVGIQQDITTDKQRELKLQDILEQTQRLMRSETVTEAAEVAVEIADETLSFPLAGVYLGDGDGRLEPTAVAESVEERLGSEPAFVQESDGRVVDRIVWDAYTAEQTQVIRNVAQEFPDLTNQTPIESGIIHPLAAHGVFITAVDAPDGFDEFDQYLVELLAALLATTVERIQQEQQLESQRDSLELLNQMVRHDIRNDLQVLVGYLDLAAEAVDGTEKQYLQTALESADNAVELTKTARDLSEVMLQDETKRQPVSLRRVVSQQADDLRSADSDAVITLDESLRGVTIRADDMFDSVIRNLLKNAVQHTRKDRPEITVSAAVEDGRVEVQIADNGPGVPDSQKESIFGKGEKGLDSEGTGIGLYLVNTVVESYGGAVWVEDNDPEGAIFVLDLPQATT
ncbi:putative light and redox sensing histidine kinase [Haloferax larsenii JCM 13917]|nr:PAS domain-containing protein [Haloferax larsenii]ELZ79653.1 putative light and redox sensing histidine kinase [Haloferax larsenii JCM 13917]